LQLVLPQDSTYNDEETDLVSTKTEQTASVKKVYVLDEQKQRHLQSLVALCAQMNRVDMILKFAGRQGIRDFTLTTGYQFGFSAGTDNLDDDKVFNFNRAPHTIRYCHPRL